MMAKIAIKKIEVTEQDNARKEAEASKKKRVDEEAIDLLRFAAFTSQGTSAEEVNLVDVAVVSIDVDTDVQRTDASSLTPVSFSSLTTSYTNSLKRSIADTVCTVCCAGDYCFVGNDYEKSCTITCGYCQGQCHDDCYTKESDGFKCCDICVRKLKNVTF